MGFFSPWFLTGLAALAVPVFVHLLRKHITVPRPMSSLMFLEQGTQSSTRHRRLRHLLLFSLRCLLLLLLVLAFASPFISKRTNAKGKDLLVIVLDNSLSMRAEKRFYDAKKQAQNLVATQSNGQQMQVISLGGNVQLLTPVVADKRQAKEAIDTLKLEDGRGSYTALARSIRAIKESYSQQIVVHLFSDMQRTALPDNFADAAMPSGARLILHNVSDAENSPNWAVERVDAIDDLTNPQDIDQSKVRATIAGASDQDAIKPVSLIINGSKTETKTVKVPAHGRITVDFHLSGLTYGSNRCAVSIEEPDVLLVDNLGRFVVRHRETQQVLFVHETMDQRSPLYFGAALNAASHGAFTLQSLTATQVADLDPSKFAYVVLSDVTSLPTIFSHSLERYVAAGGNVLMALGPNAGRQSHIPLWSEASPKPHNIASIGSATITQIDLTHPALRQEHPGRDNGGWGAVKVIYTVSVAPTRAHVLAQLNDGTPLLLEKQIGEGHVLLFTSGFDNLTNDIPLHPVFVAFVDKVSRYLSGNEESSGAYIVDSFVQLRSFRHTTPGIGVEVIDPDGHRPLTLGEAKTIQAFRLEHAGYYQLRSEGGRETSIAVNPDRRESDLAQMPKEIQALWTASPESAEQSEATSTNIEGSRFIGLWWYVMLLALIVAIAEGIISSQYLGRAREEL